MDGCLGQIDGWVFGADNMDGCLGQIDGCVDRSMDGQMFGMMDGCVDN